MKEYVPLKAFLVFYTYPGGKAHTVTEATSLAAAWRTFQSDNRQVEVTKVEDEEGNVLETKPK